jgi:hypothetical protein
MGYMVLIDFDSKPIIRATNHFCSTWLHTDVHLLIALRTDVHFCKTKDSAHHARKCMTCLLGNLTLKLERQKVHADDHINSMANSLSPFAQNRHT